MMDIFNGASVATQIVTYAYLSLLAFALIILGGAPLFGRLVGRADRIPSPVEAAVGIGLIIGFPAVIPAAFAMATTPLLLAMPLPFVGWLLIACMSLYGLYEASRHPGKGTEGCAKLFMFAFSGFGLCWSAAALILANPPVGNAASFIRPLLVAVPLALFLGKQSRSNRVRRAIGLGLLLAIFAAIAFLPVEQGFAREYLPASDLLRFPIMGAVIFAAYPLLTAPLNLIFGSRALDMRKIVRAMVMLSLAGALLGLAWAFTRLVF